MRRIPLAIILILYGSALPAQNGNSRLKIFGYFQNTLIQETGYKTQYYSEPDKNSFSLQQLNLFFQKEITGKWRAFVNFEFVNNFSSSRRWGSANLEEAWVGYRLNPKFNLKLGLLLPVFNNLNEIKNRTPLLPYIIRPIAYETSFEAFIPVDEFLPSRAFVQMYGFLPAKNLKFDYAIYLGNSPNTNNDPGQGQTGVDTTNTFLLGGRIGLRYKELKIGFSTTRDNVNGIPTTPADIGVAVSGDFTEVPRTRIGADLSFYGGKFAFESEIIKVTYDDDLEEVSIDKIFYYATIGYRFHEKLFAYASYWVMSNDFTQSLTTFDIVQIVNGKTAIIVPTVGISFNLNDRITLKAQFAPVDIEPEIREIDIKEKYEINHYSIAASVFF